MKHIVAFLILALSLTSFTAMAKIDLLEFTSEMQPINISDDQLFIFTHASTEWDGYAQAKAGTEDSFKWAANNNLKMVGIFEVASLMDSPDSYYVQPSAMDYKIISSRGGHELSMPNAKNIYIAGGFFEFCSCRTVRDLLSSKLQEFHSNETSITFVMDSIYITPKHMNRKSPYWRSMALGAETIYTTISLADISKKLSDQSFYDFVVNEYFLPNIEKEKNANRGMCKWNQDKDPLQIHDSTGVSIRLIRNGETLGTLGSSADANTPQLNFVFIDSTSSLL